MEKRETFAQQLCDILVKQNVIDEAEGRALQRSFKSSEKENFDDFLLEEGLIEEDQLLRALGQYYQVPPVDVTGYFFDTQLLRNFPKDFLLRNRIIPIEMDDDIMVVVARIRIILICYRPWAHILQKIFSFALVLVEIFPMQLKNFMISLQLIYLMIKIWWMSN